ncbi:MAG: penicillin-binding transpeptidase domain-containing protein [Pseudomonadota bacterium]
MRVYLGGAGFFGPSGQVDLVRARRSPGSTLKPFIYALAFDDLLILPDTLIDDRPMRFGDYAPMNFDRGFQGAVTVREALQQSLNLPAVQLLERVGPVRLAAALRQAGATLSFPQQHWSPGLPLALGGVGISLADLTMLYVGLANGGEASKLALVADAPAPAPTRFLGSPGQRARLRDPARLAAARRVGGRGGGAPRSPHRVQDRHLLRLPRRLGGRLQRRLHRRRLGRAQRRHTAPGLVRS